MTTFEDMNNMTLITDGIDEEQLIKRKIIFVIDEPEDIENKYKLIIKSIYIKSHKLGIKWSVEKITASDANIYLFKKLN
jgi:hypothetical protein